MSGRHPFVEADTPVAFAHRGGTEQSGENTFEAFSHAVSIGYRYLETDVHLTVDGRVVAFHDEELDRVTDTNGRIDQNEWPTIASAQVRGGGSIPLLRDLLDAFPTHRLNIDAKSDAVAEPLLRVLVDAGALDRVCVASFSSSRLTRLRERAGPSLCTALAPSEIARLRGGTTRGIRGTCVQVPPTSRGIPLVTERFLERAHRAALPVHVWTIDEPETMHALLDLGVDGIMTDRPSTLRDVLVARGSWMAHH